MLRAQRNEQRKKLLLLTSDNSLEGKLIDNLPPEPLAQKKIFTTLALKQQNKKMYQNLPEVQRKKETDKLNNLKHKNRLMTDIFNRVRNHIFLNLIQNENQINFRISSDKF